MSTATTLSRALRAAVDEAVRMFDAHPAADTAARPGPDKWSAREILGHLIDSAANNHRRFVIGQGTEPAVFDGYAQNDWVSRQHYREADWSDLVTLWRAYNLHLARIIAVMPDDVLTRQLPEGTLARVTSGYVPGSPSSTLGYLIDDYIRHLEHHMAQIKPLLQPR
jgi:hypothetical protein